MHAIRQPKTCLAIGKLVPRSLVKMVLPSLAILPEGRGHAGESDTRGGAV